MAARRFAYVLTFLIAAATCAAGQNIWRVDDDAPGDPGPGDPAVSDPLEDGSAEHPFDAIQEAIDGAVGGDEIILADGIYRGVGNRGMDLEGKAITVRSANGAESCIIDCELEDAAFYAQSGDGNDSRIEALTIMNGRRPGAATEYSAAVLCQNGAAPTIEGCVFIGGAGAVACVGEGESGTPGTVMLLECEIQNTAHPVTVADFGSVDVRNSTMTSDTTPRGAGVLMYEGVLRMTECSVSGYRYGVRGYRIGSDVCYMAGSLYITDCTIEQNIGRIGDDYVGVCVSGADIIEIRDSTVRDNVGENAVGIAAYGAHVLIENCTIDNNTASEGTAGVAGGIETEIRRCDITNNSALFTAGIILSSEYFGGEASVHDTLIGGNASSMGIAGICIHDPYSASFNAAITNCAVVDNIGQTGTVKALLFNFPPAGKAALSDCLIFGNTVAEDYDEYGIVYCSYGQAMSLTDCVIVGNSTPGGNPIIKTASTENLLLNGNVIYGNNIDSANSVIKVEDGGSLVTNNILWNNATLGGGQFHFDEFTENDVVLNNDVEGGAAAIIVDEGEFIWDESNIDAAPLFVDPDGADDDPDTWEDNDYRLSPSSPCIDAGHNGYVPADEFDLDGDGDVAEPVPFDFEGLPRFFDDAGMPDDGDAGETGLPIVDMGAFEFQGESCFGDLTGDERVTLSDLAHLLGHYGLTTGMTYSNGDFDRDGDVDLHDLSTLLGLYGNECSAP